MIRPRRTPPLIRSTLAAMALLIFAVVPASAQRLESGAFHFTSELGPVYLDGRYPVTAAIGNVEVGHLEVATSPTGALSGTLELFGRSEPVVGQITSRQKYVRLTLRGKVDKARVSVRWQLAGDTFSGTARVLGKSIDCTLVATGVSPIAAAYALNLTVNPRGAITGTGTMTVARERIALTARGKTNATSATLNLTGRKVFWRGAGPTNVAGGFEADWTAQGYGALIKGFNATVLTP